MRDFGDIENCEEAVHSIQIRTEERRRRKWNLNVGKKNPCDLGAPVAPISDNLSSQILNL